MNGFSKIPYRRGERRMSMKTAKQAEKEAAYVEQLEEQSEMPIASGQGEEFIQEVMAKEAKITTLQNERQADEKKIKHIKQSQTWKHTGAFRRLRTFFTRLTGREKEREQVQYIDELEAELAASEQERYDMREQLRETMLDDRHLNSNQIVNQLKAVKEEGVLLDYVNQAIANKTTHEANYKEALIYAARLFMNKNLEQKNLVYTKILAALKTEDIPEFMVRAGLVEDGIPLQQVASFRANLSMRVRQKQLVESLPEYMLEDKVDAYKFVDELGIRKPEISDEEYRVIDIPRQERVVIKPSDGAGSRGVYLVYNVNEIIDVKRSKQLDGWGDLLASMEADLASGWVEEDRWLMEELIFENQDKKTPASDIKFYSFYGKIGLILEITRYPERSHCWWTADGERIRTGKYEDELFVGNGVTSEEIEMASAISAKIPAPFIRIDFLRSDEGLVFGEFTSKPGNYDEFNEDIDQQLGDYYIEAQEQLVQDLLAGKKFEEFNGFTTQLAR